MWYLCQFDFKFYDLAGTSFSSVEPTTAIKRKTGKTYIFNRYLIWIKDTHVQHLKLISDPPIVMNVRVTFCILLLQKNDQLNT